MEKIVGSENSKQFSPIFIVGAPRSGTHLLRYCLNQHSDIYILPETRYFFNVYGNRNLTFKKTTEVLNKLLSKLYKSGDPSMQEFISLKEDIVQTYMKKNSTLDFAQFLNVILEKFGNKKGKTRFGEKTPNHIFYVEHILKLFPDAKILFLNRNIKNVIASYLKSSHMPNDFIQAIVQNLSSKEALAKHKKKGMLVEYEELTSSPEKVLKEVCQFIETDYQSEMLKPKMLDSSYSDKVMDFNSDIGILPDNPDKWKSVLSDYENGVVEYYFKDSAAEKPSLNFRIKVSIQLFLYKIRIKKNYYGFENILNGFIN